MQNLLRNGHRTCLIFTLYFCYEENRLEYPTGFDGNFRKTVSSSKDKSMPLHVWFFESRFADTIGKICCATCYYWRPEDRQIMVGTMQITRSHEFGGLCHSYWTKLSSPFLMLLQCAFQKLWILWNIKEVIFMVLSERLMVQACCHHIVILFKVAELQ